MKQQEIKQQIKKSVSSVEIIFKKAIYYQKQGIPFELRGTNGSYQLVSDQWENEVFVSKFKNGLKPEDLGFVRRVKNFVKKNYISLKFTNQYYTYNIDYVSLRQFPDGIEYNDVWEIDIDEAYWRTALNEGVISQSLYDEGSKFKQDPNLTPEEVQYKKRVRLIALGSLAKQTKVYKFTGKKIELIENERSSDTENVWYNICHKVGEVMKEAEKLAGDDFLFFWVDGIYVKGKENVERISQYFIENNYQSKIKKIEKFYVKDRIIHCQDSSDVRDIRTFRLPNPNKRKKAIHSVSKINSVATKYSKL
jgi:hypothetical protein